jgi:dipeptidyl aminopeptidase/acylaminoacyl peptidase
MPRPLTPETLVYDLKTAGDPQVSPDGTRVLYTLTHVDRATKQPRSQLWVCDIDGSNARQLTQSGERNSGGRWSPDGKQIAFVSDRVKKSGLFVIDMDAPGDARELTRHNQPISDLAWSPAGTRIAYNTTYDPDNPNEEDYPADAAPKVRVTRRLDYKQDTRGYLNDLRFHAFVVDVAGGERQRVTEGATDHNFPQWSPDGQWLGTLVTRQNGMVSQIEVVQLATGERELIGDDDGGIALWQWSPAGDRVIFAADPEHTAQTDFYVHDRASGATRRLTDDLQSLPAAGFRGMLPPAAPVWLDERQVMFHAMRAGASGLYTIDAERGSVEPVVAWQASHGGFSVDVAGKVVAQAINSLDHVGEINVYDMASGSSRRITSYNDALFGASPLASWETLKVRRGEFEIEAWLLKPPDFDASRKYPVVLTIHGGPQGAYGYIYNALQQLLASNGFLVVAPNPRGSSSYGRTFTVQVIRDWGGEDYLDDMAVLDAVLERPYADSARTAVFGYSYGGFMTSWILGHTDRFKAAVCGAPVFDLESFWGTSDIGHYWGEMQFGGKPHAAREQYAAHSPSEYIHNATTPTLIIHGEADDRCPIGQGEQLFVSLVKAGVETEFVRYPGQHHLFMAGGPPAHREDVLTRVLAWFQERV